MFTPWKQLVAHFIPVEMEVTLIGEMDLYCKSFKVIYMCVRECVMKQRNRVRYE